MSILTEKLKEVLYSVLPFTIIVLLLNFTITPLDSTALTKFIVGSAMIVIGLAIFLVGVDIGVTPIGNLMGSSLTKINKIWVIIVGGLLLGFFIAVAEPDLYILAGEVDAVTSGVISKLSIVILVSLGIGVMIAFGLARIVYNIPLYKVLTIIYLFILGLAFFTSPEFLAISFDASGATTGAMTVPFILALGLGVSALKKDSKASEKDSFGLVAIASTGAIFPVMIMSIISKTDEITGTLVHGVSETGSIIDSFLIQIQTTCGEIFLALLPLLTIFLLSKKKLFKLSKSSSFRILKGLVYTYIGLVIFLVGVNQGFMDAGSIIGHKLAMMDNKFIIVFIGLILGAVTILAEPAVYVLTNQIETVTSGYLKRKVVLVALSIGVGIAVALAIVRIIVPQIQLWHYLLPGYLIAIVMSFVVPKLFVGIAFDSGGVASGTMTATFILAFAHGAADAIETASVLVDGFGIISIVALTPIIALQILGLIYKIKSRKGGLGSDAKQL